MADSDVTRTIVVDARMLAYPLTGIGRYVLELLRRLVTRPRTHWVILSAGPVPAALRTAVRGSVEWVEGTGSRRAELWTQRVAARELRRRPTATFLGLGNSVPFLGPRPRRFCLLIYDMSFFVVPSLTEPSDLLKAFAVTVPSIWQAGRIIAISSAVEAELLRYFPRLRGRTSALPLGGTRIASGAIEPFERRRGFLAVGAHRRKNIDLLLQAFAALPPEVRLRHPLTIVARRLPQRVNRAVERLGLAEEVILAADLTDRELGALYSQCVALVYPSAYEGLGLPVAEAMLSGLPSIIPARSPMERFLGGAGIVVDPLEVESLAKAMHGLQSDRALWERCVAQAGQAAAAVSWDRVADAAARAIGL